MRIWFAFVALAVLAGCALLAGCARPVTAPSHASGLSSIVASPLVMSGSAAAAFRSGSISAAAAIPCGPKPIGSNPALADEQRESAPSKGDLDPARSGQPSPSAGQPPALAGELHLADLVLAPPAPGTKPATCFELALATARVQAGTALSTQQPSHAWLAIFSAPTPAHINADNSSTPYFTRVLAWVFQFDTVGVFVCAGPAAAPGHVVPCQQPTTSRQTTIITVDATTNQALTDESSTGGAPIVAAPVSSLGDGSAGSGG